MFYAVHYFMGLTESFVHGSRESFPATSEQETSAEDLECDLALNCAALTITQVQHIQTTGVKSHLLWCSPRTALPQNIKGKYFCGVIVSHVVSCAGQLTVAVAQLLGEHPTEEGSSYFSASQREKPGSVFPSRQPLSSKDAVLLKE